MVCSTQQHSPPSFVPTNRRRYSAIGWCGLRSIAAVPTISPPWWFVISRSERLHSQSIGKLSEPRFHGVIGADVSEIDSALGRPDDGGHHARSSLQQECDQPPGHPLRQRDVSVVG